MIQIPLPKNLLFIDPGVTPNATDVSDPMAQAGASLSRENSQPGDSDSTTPTESYKPAPIPAFNPEGVPKAERTGQMNKVQKELPHVHAEPGEYYGGNQVWSRARTFSNVSFLVNG